ncbi:MAG TPA: class I SAM-dependent methyltransferase [Gemmatimonadaceae bacterium]|nr:class I SAM-dependent methyltransferase [Gemmatimonadaceae bacterium]
MQWADESVHKTASYAELDAGNRMLAEYIASTATKTESILDICCNQGRLLLDLRRRGFTDLYGFDIMGPAIEAFQRNPDYDPRHIHVQHCLAQDYFRDKPEGAFDWAITHGATIELIHPEFDIFSELARTVRKGMVLVLKEDGFRYPRFYRLLHRMNGFEIVKTIQIEDSALIHSVKRSD